MEKKYENSNLGIKECSKVVEGLCDLWVVFTKSFSPNLQGFIIQGLSLLVVSLETKKMLHNGPPLWSKKFEKSNLSFIQPSQVVVPHSNVWVLFSEDLFANSNRFVPKRLSLTVLSLTKKKVLHNGPALWSKK